MWAVVHPAAGGQTGSRAGRALAVSAGADGLIGRPLEEVEKFYIQQSLELTQGNREEAATMLGIGERTLYRKIKEWGLT